MADNIIQGLEELKRTQREKAFNDLTTAKNTSLSQLDQEKAKIQPQYYNTRNQTSTASQLQAKNFAEYLANRGLANSGTSAQSEIARNSALQGQIGALNQQENQAYNDINRRTTDVNNNFNSSVASAYSGIDSDINAKVVAYQQQLAAEQRQREYESQQAELAYRRQLALQKQAQAAARAKSNNSNSNKLSAAQKQANWDSAVKRLAGMSSGETSNGENASRSELLSAINSSAAELQGMGLNLSDLRNYVTSTYNWDKDSNGNWFDIRTKKED